MNYKQGLSTLGLLLVVLMNAAYAQETTKKGKNKTLAAEVALTSVGGSGTPGYVSKWTGVSGTNTYVLGDSNIFEDKYGKVGIGTSTPTSLLTVQGMIETTLGGYKFPDGTIQTTAGIAFVTHDASLMGDGRSGSPLGIALGGVNTIHLANGAVTAPKIANGTVVRSLNGLFDNVAILAGSNITITPAGNTLTISTPNSLSSVAHDSTLTGNGTAASPLGVAAGGIGTAQLADGAVTLSKIAVNQVVTSLNNLREGVTLMAGSNITITPSGNTLTIAGAGGGSSAAFLARASFVQDFLDNPGLDVVSKTVPAGDYLLSFQIQMQGNDGDPQLTTCKFVPGVEEQFVVVPGHFTPFSFVLLGAVSVPATTTIKVHCSGFRVGAGNAILTALKVDSIQ